MEPNDFPYLLLGAAAAAQRRSRAVVTIGARAAEGVAWPATRVWRMGLVAPVRDRVGRAGAALVGDGHDALERSRADARAAGVRLLRRLADQLVGSGLADEIVDRLLSSGVFDHAVTVVINHPATETLIAGVLDDPGLDRLIARVMDSRLIDEVTARLLASEEMQMILKYVMTSPELRAALTQQTAGLAGDMAVGVRARTVGADDAAERFARSLLRRGRRTTD